MDCPKCGFEAEEIDNDFTPPTVSIAYACKNNQCPNASGWWEMDKVHVERHGCGTYMLYQPSNEDYEEHWFCPNCGTDQDGEELPYWISSGQWRDVTGVMNFLPYKPG